MKLAILGTGIVATTLRNYLKDEEADIYSDRSDIENVLPYKELHNHQYDVVFGCLNEERTREIYPHIKAKLFIDNSECFRLHPSLPLVIAGTNDHILLKNTTICSNPNCVVIMLGALLLPLSFFSVKKVIVNSMQAVSGMGQGAIDRFLTERSDYEYLDKKVTPRFTLNKTSTQLLDNIIPLVGELEGDGLSHEEIKISQELEKIIPGIEISAMCVRVPVITGHTATLHITLNETFDHHKILRLIETKTAIIYRETIDLLTVVNDAEHIYATRLKKDAYCPYGFFITLMSNNLTVGAAYNSYRIYRKYQELNHVL